MEERLITPDLSVVVVSWNVRDLLRCCLQSIIGAGAPAGEIIVVDCASSDGSVEMARHEFPSVRLIASTENLGYARGSNMGLAHACGRHLMIMNPDTEVIGDALATMVHYLDSHPEVGAVGPQLRYPDGSLQSSRRRFPTLATAFWESTLLHQWFPNNPAAHRYYIVDRPADVPQAVDWLVGAAMMVRRTAWEQVGPLDEGFFMYFEELDWCRRCHAAGWQIHYLPTAQIIHHEGKSSEQVVAARTIRFQCSKIRYFTKYYGVFWGKTIWLFLLATFGIQLAEETLKWLVGHKRELHRQRMAVYRQVLASRLTVVPCCCKGAAN
jgi:N-acetylglucosaminyl-diphospho-decaprenol L-rhamnosyltransferase